MSLQENECNVKTLSEANICSWLRLLLMRLSVDCSGKRKQVCERSERKHLRIPLLYKHEHILVFTWPLLQCPTAKLAYFSLLLFPQVSGNRKCLMPSPEWSVFPPVFLQHMPNCPGSLGQVPAHVLFSAPRLWILDIFKWFKHFFLWRLFWSVQTNDFAHACAGRAGHLQPQQVAPVHGHTHRYVQSSQCRLRAVKLVCVLQATWVMLSHSCETVTWEAADCRVRQKAVPWLLMQGWSSANSEKGFRESIAELYTSCMYSCLAPHRYIEAKTF